MGLPIISAEERLKERHSAKICLVGFPGVGKTSQIKTLPAQSTLFVDLEAGDLTRHSHRRTLITFAPSMAIRRSWPSTSATSLIH
jgi:ATP-dependent Lon protease